MSQTLGLVLQMLTTVCSKHRAVWPADSNDRGRDYNGSKDKAQIPINDNLRAITHLTFSRWAKILFIAGLISCFQSDPGLVPVHRCRGPSEDFKICGNSTVFLIA